MKGTYLGEFEEVILLIVAILNGKAYGNSLKEEFQGRANRSVNLSAIHAALYRLEQKGFVKSQFGEPTCERGGKRKRFFSATNKGLSALQESRDLRKNLWADVPVNALSKLR
ncbi:MAG TPA: helix-turn-helix transcriptional regulator [Cyclobacteriaceae bacterium]|jgi:DNA-binding PadR family transcriptional regulator